MVAVRTAFDRQLRELDADLLRLAAWVETQLNEAIGSLYDYDLAMAHKVDRFDAELNRLRYDIEERCYALLALQQPVSSDMRRIVAAVSIATNLERMGDHAAGIARLVLRMSPQTKMINIPTFRDMAKLANENLNKVMGALHEHDAALSRTVVKADDDIDRMHKEVYDMLIKTMIDDPQTVEAATMLLWVSHNIERFGDRILNINERIMYMITGNLFEPRRDPMP